MAEVEDLNKMELYRSLVMLSAVLSVCVEEMDV